MPGFEWSCQKVTAGCETIACPVYHPYKDFKADPSGHYVLIRVNFEHIRIEVAVCNSLHEIVKIFHGGKAQDIYHALFQHERATGVTWLGDKNHIAYFGKELKKAELALVLGQSSYFQE